MFYVYAKRKKYSAWKAFKVGFTYLFFVKTESCFLFGHFYKERSFEMSFKLKKLQVLATQRLFPFYACGIYFEVEKIVAKYSFIGK